MEALLQPRTNLLPPSIRAVYIHSAFKVLSFCLHSFLLPNKTANSLSKFVDMEEPDFTYSDSEKEFPEASGLRPEFNFNPRDESETNATNSSSSLKKDALFSRDSVVNLLTLVLTSSTPLAGSHDVEIQERTRNLLGLAHLAQHEISCNDDRKEKMVDRDDLKTSIVIRLIDDALSEDFGPVSLSAQERVSVPDGLLLEENLSKLDIICADVQLPKNKSFSLVRPSFVQTDGGDSVSSRQNEESETSAAESTSLLSEHRKRHGLFYLPSDNNNRDASSRGFPSANEPNKKGKDVEDLVKATDESLVLKRKSSLARPRPVVVKLDEGERLPVTSNKTQSNDDLISGAVRDVLLGNEKPSGRRKGKAPSKVDMKENFEVGNSSKRRSKHRKEKKHPSPGDDDEGRDENGETIKQKSGSSRHHGSRHKARQRADSGGLNVVVQKPVIPDFLL